MGDREEKVIDEDPNDKRRRKKVNRHHRGRNIPHKYRETYFVSKYLILRLMGTMYLFSFLTAYFQLPALIGPEEKSLPGGGGLAPAAAYVRRIREEARSGRAWHEQFLAHPTIFSWFPADVDGGTATSEPLSGGVIRATSAAGIALSVPVMLGLNSFLVLSLLWILDHSVVTVAAGASTFYAYGWESQILETGFLCLFLCDLPHLFTIRSEWRGIRWSGLRGILCDDDDSPAGGAEGGGTPATPPSRLPALWLLRWLMFRITVGAGLIKLRGSSCWTQKTCLHYHFETQPLPSPLSFVFHFLPKDVLSTAVNLDLTVQLYLSWMVLVPGWGAVGRNLRRAGGYIQALFMLNIMASGNYSFLNHLTVLPALACLDDDAYPPRIRQAVMGVKPSVGADNTARVVPSTLPARPFRKIVDCALLLLIAYLSKPVILNLLQLDGRRGQAMNASYDPLKLVNTYGAFGSVGERRYEPIISISSDGVNWHEIEFPCKPGDLRRRPCFCAPYHYRVDWNIWFIGFKPHLTMLQQREHWVYALLIKMLETRDQEAMHAAEWKKRRVLSGKRKAGSDGAVGNADLEENSTLLSPPQFLTLLDQSSAKHFPPAVDLGPKYAKVDMYHYEMVAPLWTILGKKVRLHWEDLYSGRGLLRHHDVQWWTRKFEEVLIPPVMIDPRTGRNFMRIPAVMR